MDVSTSSAPSVYLARFTLIHKSRGAPELLKSPLPFLPVVWCLEVKTLEASTVAGPCFTNQSLIITQSQHSTAIQNELNV